MDQNLDIDSYNVLKQSYDQLLANFVHLETQNEKLVQSNHVLKRLMSALESIKESLEQKVLIMTSHMNGDCGQQLGPFDRDIQCLDEDYCQLKCLLNRLDFDEEEDEDNDMDDNGVIIVSDDTTGHKAHLMDQTLDNDINDQSSDQFCGQNRFNEDLDQTIDDNCVQYVVHHLTTGQQLVTTTGQTADVSTDDVSINELTTCSLSYDSLVLTEDSLVKRQRNRRSKGVTTPGVKRFKCSWNGCQYQTDSSGNFQKHYRIHTGEKPYKCDFNGCEYSCSDPGSIKEHKRIHSSEKEYECEWKDCNWKFSTYKLLKNHKRACHTGDKPHKCDWPGCDKSFLAPYALRTHKLKHTGDRPHKCDITSCTASFARSTDLARHKRETHCTERHYLCEHENCGSKFYRKDDLKHHIKRKHDCPQFGRRQKRMKKVTENKDENKSIAKSLRLRKDANKGVGGDSPSDASAPTGLDEPKVVIDLKVAKVNQLKKSIQISFS